MRQKIRDWYSERHYQPHKMINAGIKWGFNQVQIESSMIYCYGKIVDEGKKISDGDVARYVRNVCKDVETIERGKELVELYESRTMLKEYKETALCLGIVGILINVIIIIYFAVIY